MAKRLADRGVGTAASVVDAGLTPEPLLQDYFRKLSLEDLEAMTAILKKYSPDVAEVAEPRQLRFGSRSLPAAR